jgi:hypothetical protein
MTHATQTRPPARRTATLLLALLGVAAPACTRLVVFGHGADPGANDDASVPGDAADPDIAASVPGVVGAAWRPVASPVTTDLRAVWGAAADDVWAVGASGVAVHWDGRAWTSVSTGIDGTLRALWGSGASDLWAAGWDDADAALVLHWDGRAWTRDASVTDNYPIRGLWGASGADVWAVGGAIDAGSDLVLHWDGQAWNRVAMNGQFTPYVGVAGSAGDDAWLVTDDQSVDRWDGHAWHSEMDRPWRALLTGGVWLAGYQDVFFTGASGYVYRDDHGTWTRTSLGSATLHAITGTRETDLWAVGDNGTILHSDGTRWAAAASITAHGLWGIWTASPTEGWSVGDQGTILHLGPD